VWVGGEYIQILVGGRGFKRKLRVKGEKRKEKKSKEKKSKEKRRKEK
jgi:hypothetical protein